MIRAVLLIAFLCIYYVPVYAESFEKDYKPCTIGPTRLQSVDSWERDNKKVAEIELSGRSLSIEEFAEILIADCSKDFAMISAMASGNEIRSMSMVRDAWKEDLEFMKWWLKNRYQKRCQHQAE